MRTVVLACLALTVPLASAREWTNNSGKTLEADFVRVEGDKVVLLIDGREVKYPIASLSLEDQDYIDLQPVGGRSVETEAPEAKVAGRTAEFDAPVPDQVGPPADVTVETIKEDAENSEYVYASPNFEFVCNRRLTSRVISGFAKLYEATYGAVEAMPWGAKLDPGSASGRFVVRLFSDEEEFIAAGGIRGSAGTAVGPLSLAQLKYLGVKDTGSRLILEDIEDNTLLVHELTHSLRHHADRGLPTWAVEGFAEYLASAPYQRIGRFSFKDRLGDSARYARRKAGAGAVFKLPMRLEEMLDSSRGTFYRQSSGIDLGAGASLNYAMALLTMTWLWHEDRGKDGTAEPGAPVRAWLAAIRDGKPEREARPLLLDGRSCEEIEEALVKAYRREIDLEFE